MKQKLRRSHTGAVGKFFSVAKPCCNCGLVPSMGERCSPLQICCRGSCFSRFFIQFSSFKQGAGSAFLCDQNLSSCSPNSRPQNVSSYTATLQDIRFGIISLYLSRKMGTLLHKKCNNCRNVAKLKDKSFVCTSLVVKICAVITENYYRNIDENTRKNSVSMQLSHNFNIYQYMQF